MGRERKKMYLTDDERTFITENHNLLLKFMHVHNIDIDQYYGVLAEGFCRCVRSYDRSKGAFSTFVWKVLQREYQDAQKLERLPSKYVNPEHLVYLDQIVYNDEKNTEKSELIGCEESAYSTIETNDTMRSMKKYLKENTKCNAQQMGETLDLLLAGKSQAEISTYYGVSIQAVNQRVKTLQRAYGEVRGNAYACC